MRSCSIRSQRGQTIVVLQEGAATVCTLTSECTQLTQPGDTAIVTSYLQILVPQTQGEPVAVPNHGTSKGFRAHRVGANRWDLVRTKQGWKVKHRVSRPLDGSEPARKILRQGLVDAMEKAG